MMDTNKFQRGGVPPEQEDSLESVSGGVTFKEPKVGARVITRTCPVCGATITDNVIDRVSERLQCPKCGRWFRLVGTALVEE